MKLRGVLLCLFLIWPISTQAFLYATLQGHEEDLTPDGRNMHVVVAGYGGGLGLLPYEMAVSRAKKLKENFPNDRVVILGSTSYYEGSANNRNAPERLEQSYDISIHSAYKSGGSFSHIASQPLTADGFTESLLYAISDPRSVESYANGRRLSFEALEQGLRSGAIQQRGEIRSIDFITHSSPMRGIHLHNDNYYYKEIPSNEVSYARSRGFEVMEEDGVFYVKNPLPEEQKSLTAGARNLSALNGFFTDDAYVNMAGCSGGYGHVTDFSRILGVPVSGTANGSEVYIMAQDGEYYYNYPSSNPYEDRPLSESLYAMLGHELSADLNTAAPMSFKPGLRMYNGYWGVLRSGTNFTVTSCVVRDEHHSSDLARCEMGMARRIEDTLSANSSEGKTFEITDDMSAEEKSRVQTEKFKNYLATLKDNMCPDGKGLDTKYEVVTRNCHRAIDTLAALSMNCNVNANDLNQASSASELSAKFPDRFKNVCSRYAQEYIDEHKDFVPLLDQHGKTLVCDLNGCRVRIKGCDITTEERQVCWNQMLAAENTSNPQIRNIFEHSSCYATESGPSRCLQRAFCTNCSESELESFTRSDQRLKKYERCLNTKRCEIDEEHTEASNHGNLTFMKYIQHYIDGYVKLELYRSGKLQIDSDHPRPQRLSVDLVNSSSSSSQSATGIR